MKPVGKPDAGNPHVRFDERGRETECCRMAQATAPVLDSTPLTLKRANYLPQLTKPLGFQLFVFLADYGWVVAGWRARRWNRGIGGGPSSIWLRARSSRR